MTDNLFVSLEAREKLIKTLMTPRDDMPSEEDIRTAFAGGVTALAAL